MIQSPSQGLGAEDANERLHALAAQAGSAHCYLLMQPSGGNDAHDTRFRQHIEDAAVTPVAVRIDKLPERFWPVVFALDLERGAHATLSALAVDMALADTTPQAMERGQIQRTCEWIFSDLSIGQLTRQLATTAVTRHPVTHMARWLRYYDPLVADMFWSTCAPAQLAYFLNGIASLAYIDRWQSLQVVSGESDTTPSAVLPPSAWERLDGIGALNQAWVRTHSEGAQIVREQFSAAVLAVQHGVRRGLRPGAGLDLFAWQALHLGPGFYRHRQVQALLEQVSAGEDYTELANQLDDAHWQGIGMEAGNFQAPSTQERITP
ncbi:DUF4123 domain-containing protein [Xanthomonas maliensis]|uniref:DUF4123 domain-containing protein n=1 Tax=Xanthomonas maliensis TaxID=1321368 RepID=UPI001264436A|nr:DUF4123 domain-containing protein [Xanthomonas maliensis]KAB7769101.1 hypothetical protein CKY51_07570 [Xanthomonas maliensis]